MRLYDWLSYDKTLPSTASSASTSCAAEPAPRRDGAIPAPRSSTTRRSHSPERLALENVIDAREHGASVWNYAEVTEAIREAAASPA